MLGELKVKAHQQVPSTVGTLDEMMVAGNAAADSLAKATLAAHPTLSDGEAGAVAHAQTMDKRAAILMTIAVVGACWPAAAAAGPMARTDLRGDGRGRRGPPRLDRPHSRIVG